MSKARRLFAVGRGMKNVNGACGELGLMQSFSCMFEIANAREIPVYNDSS